MEPRGFEELLSNGQIVIILVGQTALALRKEAPGVDRLECSLRRNYLSKVSVQHFCTLAPI